MKVGWDPDEAASDLAKHDIRFSDAESVLFDDFALTREDESVSGEQRWVTVGLDAARRILVVVYTYRSDDSIRLISARRATPQERRRYEN